MKVKISNISKSPTQSGYGKGKFWILTNYEENPSRSINNTTSWVSSNNTKNQIKLRFTSEKEAVSYAQDNGFEYFVEIGNKANIKKKSYTDNFVKKIF